MYQVFDVVRWPPPENEAVTRILEPRFNAGIALSQKNLIYDDAGKIFLKHFGFLLRVSCDAV